MFDLDIASLVSETFNSSSKIHSAFEEYAGVPGILYRVVKGKGTFIVKGVCCRDLQQSRLELESKPTDIEKLAISAIEDELGLIDFFPCDNFQVALQIGQNIFNKRFSLTEDYFFNVSDPTDHWWLIDEQGKFEVSFKFKSLERKNQVVKLGPLGNSHKSHQILRQLRSLFEKLFPITKYAVTRDGFVIEIDEQSATEVERILFEDLKLIFFNGEPSGQIWAVLRDKEMNATHEQVRESIGIVSLFLMEISTTRSFWRDVNAKLDLMA